MGLLEEVVVVEESSDGDQRNIVKSSLAETRRSAIAPLMVAAFSKRSRAFDTFSSGEVGGLGV